MLASALLVFIHARGGAAWPLAFVAFVPWLRTLDAQRSPARSLLGGWAMSVAYTAAVFPWLASAIAAYAGVHVALAWAVLLLGAPAFQPQLLAYALVRHVAGLRHGPLLRALAAAAAWAATEWLVPRLLDDTYGYGLYPSRLLRQAADVCGVGGLTVLALLANEGVALALARRGDGARAIAIARPLAAAVAVPLLLAAYGLAALSPSPESPTPGVNLRVALVQSAITDYERRRSERGAAAAVQEILDMHGAMSYDAVERQHADAVLWSETVYPTTFGHPKSEAGAQFDRAIVDMVRAAGVPFVFGTYDRDAAGEYNAAAFVEPGRGLLGMYRKARPFPITEYVPPWLDGPTLRRWLPWAGTWLPGTGARVFPLRLRDGHEVPVLPLICLDDMDAALAIDGARLGAQAILTLSNDAWFSQRPLGAQWHLAGAAFRSIETRLPQLRVTTNGYSAVIDATGTVTASTRMGQRTLVIGDVAVREPPRTLMMAWGPWVGRAATVFLLALAAIAAARRAWPTHAPHPASPLQPMPSAPLPPHAAVLPPAARWAAALLRAFARASLLAMAVIAVFGDAIAPSNPLAQLRAFTVLVLAPEAAAWCVLRAWRARMQVDGALLVCTRGRKRLQLALHDIVAVEPWRVPVPGPGASIRLAGGRRWPYDIALADPAALRAALGVAAGAPVRDRTRGSAWTRTYLETRRAMPRGWPAQPWAKFVALAVVLAIPAFRLHQHIAYGATFGEYRTYGLRAYLQGFALWWATWIMIVAMCAAVLRAGIEAATVAAALLRPSMAATVRAWLERIALAMLYVGLPAWLLVRIAYG